MNVTAIKSPPINQVSQQSPPWFTRVWGFLQKKYYALSTTSKTVLAAAITGAVICQTWFQFGTFLATGDNAPLLTTFRASELWSIFNHDLSGAGSTSYLIGHFYDTLWATFAQGVGIPDTLAQRLYITFWVALLLASTAWFLLVYTKRFFAVFIVSVFVLVNPFMITHLPNMLIIFQLIVMVLVAGIALRVANNENISKLWWLLPALLTAPMVYNAPQLIVVFLWAVVVVPFLVFIQFGKKGLFKTLKHVGIALPLLLLASLWYLVPFVLTVKEATGGGDVAAQTDIVVWSWTHINSSIINILDLSANHAWGKPQYYPDTVDLSSTGYVTLRLVVPLLVLASPFLVAKKYQRLAIFTVLGILFLVFISKGLHSPGTDINIWLYRHVPGMWVLREPFGKLGPIHIVLYAVLLVLVFDRFIPVLQKAIKNVSWRTVVYPAIAVAVPIVILVSGSSMITGGIAPDTRPILPPTHVSIPQDWQDIAGAINTSPIRGKTLVLPIDDYYQMPTDWGYYGVDIVPTYLLTQPSAVQTPGGYFADPPGYAAILFEIENAVITDNVAQLPALLARIGAAHVILRHDLDTTMFNYRTFTDPQKLTGVAKAPGLTLRLSTEVGDLYDVTPINADQNSTAMVQVRQTQSPSGVGLQTPRNQETLGVVLANTAASVALSVQPGTENQSAAPTISDIPKSLPGPGRVVFNNILNESLFWEQKGSTLIGTPKNSVQVNSTITPTPPWTMSLTSNQKVSLLRIGNELYPATSSHYAVFSSGSTVQAFSSSNVETKQKPNKDVEWSSKKPVSTLLIDSTSNTAADICAEVDTNCAQTLVVSSGSNSWSTLVTLPKSVSSGILQTQSNEEDASITKVVALDNVGQTQVVLPAPAAVLSEQANTTVLFSGPDKVTLDQWSEVGDCNNNGQVPFDETGITSKIFGNQVVLHADLHSACVTAPIQLTPGVSTFDLHLKAQASAPGSPRICVYTQPSKTCAPLTPLLISAPEVNGWKQVDTTVTLPAHTNQANLYLYADSSLGPSTVTYKDILIAVSLSTQVAMLPLNSPLSTFNPTDKEKLPYQPESVFINSSSWDAKIPPGPAGRILVLTERSSKNWVLQGVQAEPLLVDGYAQGWVLPSTDSETWVQIRYKTNLYYQAALAVSSLTLLTVLFFVFYLYLRKRNYAKLQKTNTSEAPEEVGSGEISE